ncbi:MAG: hypothetical protein M1376_12100 [Planctomycetes bacterium]|nr:hypothetical protein [Planctomycetota bacterium]
MSRPNWPFTLISVGVIFLATTAVEAADWPQWQGPNRDGKSADTGLLKEWPKEGLSLAWKIKGLGGGYSGPSIAAGRIFGMSHRGEDEVVWALSEEVYSTRKMQNHHGGMIVVDGCLYGANGGNEGGSLVCLDFQTGNVLWDGRDKGVPKGSLALADGRLYYRLENGTMLLIEPNSKQYVERGRFEQPDRTKQPAWTHPVIANGKLYLRDQDVLFCYNIK